MENVRKRMTMELVSSDIRYIKLVNKTNYKPSTIYNENLCAVHLNSDVCNFNKPIYVGLSILEISKILMYDFHYNHMKKHYNDKIELLYMDTGKVINYFNFYKLLKLIICYFRFIDVSNSNSRFL